MHRIPLVAICCRKHILDKGKSVRLDALSEENFVDLTPERALRKLVDQIFLQHHLHRTIVYQVNDVQTMLNFVAKGLGIAILPSALAPLLFESGQLQLLQIVNQAPRLPKWRIAIVSRSRRRDLPGKTTVELFLEMLASLTVGFGRPLSRPHVGQRREA
jgi:DNA-binding transcriptional LysR family regulator